MYRDCRKLHEIFNLVTSSFREYPDFFILGAARCGKSTIHNYLLQNPHVMNSFRNETSFFDINYEYGLNWYRSNFPLHQNKLQRIKKVGSPIRIGEVIHIHSLFVPRRIKEIIKEPKIIVLLRNPVDRAFSHFLMSRELGDENEESFKIALKKEGRRLKENENLEKNINSFSRHNRQWFQYKSNGIYVKVLGEWLKYFSKKNMKFVSSEQLFSNSLETIQEVEDFLELPKSQILKNENTLQDVNEQKMEEKIRGELIEFFRPFNKELYSMIGIDFGWDK